MNLDRYPYFSTSLKTFLRENLFGIKLQDKEKSVVRKIDWLMITRYNCPRFGGLFYKIYADALHAMDLEALFLIQLPVDMCLGGLLARLDKGPPIEVAIYAVLFQS